MLNFINSLFSLAAGFILVQSILNGRLVIVNILVNTLIGIACLALSIVTLIVRDKLEQKVYNGRS